MDRMAGRFEVIEGGTPAPAEEFANTRTGKRQKVGCHTCGSRSQELGLKGRHMHQQAGHGETADVGAPDRGKRYPITGVIPPLRPVGQQPSFVGDFRSPRCWQGRGH